MATTTPNFGWSVPTSSDLVKNGATAIETLGDSIDASLVDLKGGTTGQVLAKASGTDMDFSWVTDASGMTNPMTTTGDVIYSSSGSTPDRLGIGTAGQVLQVNSGATAPEWATPAAGGGGLTFIKSQTIGSAVSSVTVTDAFSSTYDNYLITVTGGTASTTLDLKLTLGATTSDYYFSGVYMSYSATTVTGFNLNNGAYVTGGYGTTNTLSGRCDVQSPNLAKRTVFITNNVQAATDGVQARYQGFLNNNTQYTAFTLTTNTGNITGGTIRVYGYQNS
jgi:hypothetical protein